MNILYKITPLIAALLIISCSDKGKKDKDMADLSASDYVLYPSIEKAAAAAQADMLAIIDSIPLGFSKDSLAAATPGTPITCSNIDLKYILQSDSSTSFDSLPKEPFPTQVPFMGSNNRVVTVVAIHNQGGKYSIGQLVNFPLSAQLDSVMYAYNAPLTGIVEIYTMQATVFVTGKADDPVYYLGNNNVTSAMKPMNGAELMKNLKLNAEYFTNKFPKDTTETYW